MHRFDFFRELHTEVMNECKQLNIVFTYRKLLDTVKDRLSDNKWEAIKHRIDERHNGLPHHFNENYPTTAKGKAELKKRTKQWKIDRYIYMYGEPKCKTCGATAGPSFTKFYKRGAIRVNDILEFCSSSCSKKHPDAYAKREATCLKKYGVRNATFLPQTLAAQQAVFADPERAQEILNKRNSTLIEKHGSVKAAQRNAAKKRCATNQERYGGNAPTCSQKVLNKRDANYMAKHGVKNPSQNPEVWEKITTSWKHTKKLKIKGIRFEGLQGYEPQVIKWLVKERDIEPSNIKTKIKPIKYEWENETRYYYPDIKIGKTLIEVKSTYTLGLDGKTKDGHGDYRLNKAKIKAAVEQGYKIAVIIYSDKLKNCFVHKGELPKRQKLLALYTDWVTSHL